MSYAPDYKKTLIFFCIKKHLGNIFDGPSSDVDLNTANSSLYEPVYLTQWSLSNSYRRKDRCQVSDSTPLLSNFSKNCKKYFSIIWCLLLKNNDMKNIFLKNSKTIWCKILKLVRLVFFLFDVKPEKVIKYSHLNLATLWKTW